MTAFGGKVGRFKGQKVGRSEGSKVQRSEGGKLSPFAGEVPLSVAKGMNEVNREREGGRDQSLKVVE